MTLEEQVRELAQLRARKEETAREAEEAKRAYDKAHHALWERMDATKVTGVTVDGTQYVYNKPTVYGSVSDKAAFLAWAEEHEPELVAPSPREGLINELVRQRIDNNEELPPGINWYTKENVSQRKSR